MKITLEDGAEVLLRAHWMTTPGTAPSIGTIREFSAPTWELTGVGTAVRVQEPVRRNCWRGTVSWFGASFADNPERSREQLHAAVEKWLRDRASA